MKVLPFYLETGEIIKRYFDFVNKHITQKFNREGFFDFFIIKSEDIDCDEALSELFNEIEASRKIILSAIEDDSERSELDASYNDLLAGMELIFKSGILYKTSEIEARKLLKKSNEIILKLKYIMVSKKIKILGKNHERTNFARTGSTNNGLDYSEVIEYMKSLIKEKCVDGFLWKSRTEAARNISQKIIAYNDKISTTRKLSTYNIEKKITEWISSNSAELDQYFQRASRK